MATTSCRHFLNPLLLPELVAYVIDYVDIMPDLLNCACVHSVWSVPALKRLYKGSMHEMHFHTPDIGSLNSLFVASRERFARNMSFVKHLVIAPETPSHSRDRRFDSERYVSLEKCRPMRHRQYAELLLRPRETGPSSLAIPFQIVDQDFSHISDLLLPPTVESLTIDASYCEALMSSYSYSRDLIAPAGRLSNLKALTIYRSHALQKMEPLYQLLRSCDLQFFHYEEKSWIGEDSTPSPDYAELLPCLEQHQNLRTVTLIICSSSRESLKPVSQTFAWTRLNTLYLNGSDKYWLELIPKLEKLEILRVRWLGTYYPDTISFAAERVAKCHHLRVLDIGLPFSYKREGEMLLDIARSCPLLQELSVYRHRGVVCEISNVTPDQLSDLLRALPFLALLRLSLKFRVDGARLLEDLKYHCSRLIALELTNAWLCLSLPLMMNAHPIGQLKIMAFDMIFFQNPRRLMRRDKLYCLATEWCRVFPGIRDIPCSGDTFTNSLPKDTLSDDESEREDSYEEAQLTEPESIYDDYHSYWKLLRVKLWRLLDYRTDTFSRDRDRNKWRANLEIKTTIWPVVPLDPFIGPYTSWTTSVKPMYWQDSRLN